MKYAAAGLGVGLILIVLYQCGSNHYPAPTKGLRVTYDFSGADAKYQKGFTGFIVFGDASGKLELPMRWDMESRKGFMDHVYLVSAPQDPSFGVEEQVELNFPPMPSITRIYVGHKIIRRFAPGADTTWHIQEFPATEFRSTSDPAHLVIPVKKLGLDKTFIDGPTHKAVFDLVVRVEEESRRISTER